MGSRHILELCSGAGGPWFWLQPVLAQQGRNVAVCLTDIHPHLDAATNSNGQTDQHVRYHREPVDALRRFAV